MEGNCRRPRGDGSSCSAPSNDWSRSNTPHVQQFPSGLNGTLDALDIFTVGAGPLEIALKRRILRAHAIASTRAASTRDPKAGHAYWLADQLALDWLPRRGAGLEELEEVIKGMTLLFLFAGLVARLDAPNA